MELIIDKICNNISKKTSNYDIENTRNIVPLSHIIDPILDTEWFRLLKTSLQSGRTPLHASGLSESQKAHLAFSICTATGRRGIYAACNELQAKRIYEDFRFFFGDDVAFFPSKEIMLYDIEAKSNESVHSRVEALHRLLSADCKMVVVSAEALSLPLISPEDFISRRVVFTKGMIMSIEEAEWKLMEAGYDKVSSVEGRGHFARRGGVMDIFTPDAANPFRIEFFGDEVDSLRSFDVISQRSLENINKVIVPPAKDIIFSVSKTEDIISKIEKELQKIKEKEWYSRISAKIHQDIDKFREFHYFAGMDRYLPFIVENPCTITDYARDAVIFLDEPVRFRQRMDNLLLEFGEMAASLIEHSMLLPASADIYKSCDWVFSSFEKNDIIAVTSLSTGNAGISRIKEYVGIPAREVTAYSGQTALLFSDIKTWKESSKRVLILAGPGHRGERLREMLNAEGIETVYIEQPASMPQKGQVVITAGSLAGGFEYLDAGFVVVSGRETFGMARRWHGRTGNAGDRRQKVKGSKISIFTDLRPGDFVVHAAHGIGQFVCMEKLTVDGMKKEYLKICYQGGDLLYIPATQLEIIQKYIGGGDKAPKVNKLGGQDWARTRKKVRESLRELAIGLVRLYASRQELKGHAFQRDTVWQKQFEDIFQYEETGDQLRSIEEIKKDMEMQKPMDRLLCGDVGYGKTEVALRAIFKALMDNKQVAYLVPTTVLALQQFNNFKERMKDFPVTVEMLSRFRSKTEQIKVLKALKAGHVDVLIGTHRLLSKDIGFKNLGLLVVDEEQRFGVMHKEQIKNLRPDIDVLTLTATPIPRTLHMSLTGIRDISVIDDPPENRHPVQTYVMEYNPGLVRDAIIRELVRKGQVFYLFNRVRSIDIKAMQLKELVPEARIAVAHGQMEEKKLEDIMIAFLDGEYDILICTTIIESGLDMPNVNTIIVEDADRMGLSQLYQLRGRVGRSNRQAYAYVTYKRDKVLTEIAEKRLKAIKEFTEFGSGFRIAMRDLEIRGAGNLLGPEQHGHIDAVGYEMYCRLLEEAVMEIRQEKEAMNVKGAGTKAGNLTDVSTRNLTGALSGSEVHTSDATLRDDSVDTSVNTTVDINIAAYLDDDYIENEIEKIDIYKKIAAVENEEDAADIADELIDRFGRLPTEAMNLIDISLIRVLAGQLGIVSVQARGNKATFTLRDLKKPGMEVIGKIASRYKKQILFSAGKEPVIIYKTPEQENARLLSNIKILLQDMQSLCS